MDYIEYYFIEERFFLEIYKFFHREKYLTPKHFFSIIIWKRNASKVIIKEKLGKPLGVAIKNLTKKIALAKSKEGRLEILIKQPGFKLAMASAVLTVLYPDDFTVYDYRVRGQLNYPDITYDRNVINRYFEEYVDQVRKKGRKIARDPKLSLRDCDRLLWAKSWYEDLEEFITKPEHATRVAYSGK